MSNAEALDTLRRYSNEAYVSGHEDQARRIEFCRSALESGRVHVSRAITTAEQIMKFEVRK